MKHSNISIFIPHLGCPNMCSFCNQHTISGEKKAPTSQEIRSTLQEAVDNLTNSKENTEIAFFGGSFTAIDRCYMISLLEVASEFVTKYGLKGIRLSTRPDKIDDEVLSLLKKYGVTAIELGAQSMSDEVLFCNDRGHTSLDVEKASALIKSYGFELGLQMMVGLYKDTEQTLYQTVDRFIKINPDTVRIYPTVILKGTKLATLYQSGEYKTLSLDKAVGLCADILQKFLDKGINVIKLGLHASEQVEGDFVGGIYHPAFKELCENDMYYNMALSLCKTCDKSKPINLKVSTKAMSKMIGQKKKNIEKLNGLGYQVKVIGDKDIPLYKIEMEG